ncbi:MAG: thiamine phosphate synthase [Planctomycetota bacterium]
MTETLYRIIDANYNRAREAFRVMEEYCRFELNNTQLSSQAKQHRHELCDVLNAISQEKLLSNRDTDGDVGRELKVERQLQRKSLEDCFTAAAKRASEALRALAETTQALDPAIAASMEKLRFKSYSLEKNAVLYACSKRKFEAVRLYILINATAQADERKVLDLAKVCVDNAADCLQLRAKDCCDSSLLHLAQKFTSLCKEAGVVSIINDRVDIAVLSDADGVHLGQDEIPVACARQLARRPLVVGVSTHNLNELQHAIDSGCDYVGIGPAFASPTKPLLEIAGTDYLQQAIPILEKAGMSHVAIGGINTSNIPELLQIGVRTVAVSAAIENSKNPAGTCKTLKNILLSSS